MYGLSAQVLPVQRGVSVSPPILSLGVVIIGGLALQRSNEPARRYPDSQYRPPWKFLQLSCDEPTGPNGNSPPVPSDLAGLFVRPVV
jgi:hypothetical protein